MRKYQSFRVFKEKISFLIDRKALAVIVLLLFVMAGVFIFSTGTGEMKISPINVVKVFFGGGTDM